MAVIICPGPVADPFGGTRYSFPVIGGSHRVIEPTAGFLVL